MKWWLRGAYGAAGRLADLASTTAPAPDAARGGRKLLHGLTLRRGAADRLVAWAAAHRDVSRPLLWLHAASVGEGLMALPIAQRLRLLVPGVQLAYTYYSPSAVRFARTLGADVTDALPFDTPRAARTLLDALRPTALVFVRGDVWPVLTEEAAGRGVPVALVNAALARDSGRTHGIGAALLRDAYAALARVGAVDTPDAARLVAAGVRAARIEVTGDTRYDQAWTRAHERPRHAHLVQQLRSPRPTLVAGSTWPADERHLLDAWELVRKGVPHARLVIAPHEIAPGHLAALETWGSAAGLLTARLDAATPATDVVLVDRVGVLAELYAVGDAAYVGGGFHAAGLHSVVEPAVLGIPVIIGPAHHEGRDAALLLTHGAAVAVRDARTLAAALTALVTDPARRARMAAGARDVVAAELGAADRAARLVRELLGTV